MPFFGKRQQSSRQGVKKNSRFSSKPDTKKDEKEQKDSWGFSLFQKGTSPKAKPDGLFQDKKELSRNEFLRETARDPFKPKNYHKRRKLLDEAFPYNRFGNYISETEVKTRLRELRREEYQAKTYDEKTRISRLRRHLESETGLRGKY